MKQSRQNEYTFGLKSYLLIKLCKYSKTFLKRFTLFANTSSLNSMNTLGLIVKRYFLIFFCLTLSLSAVASDSCFQFLKTPVLGIDLGVIRFGYLPLEGRTAGGSIRDILWSVSILGKLQDGQLGWQRSISSKSAVQYYEFPLPSEILNKSEKIETTKNLSQPSLSFVYQSFRAELRKRKVFTNEFIDELKIEDQNRIEDNLTVWIVISADKQIVSTWGLYFHSEGPFQGKYEVIRLAKAKDHGFSVLQAMPFISEYLNSTRVNTGTLVVRTDEKGSRLFRRIGAEIKNSYDDNTKFILEMSVENFLETFSAPDILHGNQPLHFVRFLDENFIF
jgi:hypothetical protein